jgi:hypothetical protein
MLGSQPFFINQSASIMPRQKRRGKMPDNLNPNQPANPEGGAAPAGSPETPPAQTSVYKDLQTKKGFKSEEDLAKSYVESEQALGRHQNITDKVKRQLENAGYTVDEEGNIKPISSSSAMMPPVAAGQMLPETIYDPYTGSPITDPVALQLARMPIGHREMFIVNAMLEQREKLNFASVQADSEILSKPEAKGFEEDVRKVMQQLPLAQRADKKSWEDALLRVKGMRYDAAMKNAGEQWINEFINKERIQRPAGSGGGAGGTTLNSEQEATYQWYAKNQPGLFKDRAHFLKATLPDGGRE